MSEFSILHPVVKTGKKNEISYFALAVSGKAGFNGSNHLE